MTGSEPLAPTLNPSNVSVIIPFFGQPGPTLTLIEQISSGLNQPLEVIVIDDASPVPFPTSGQAQVIRRVRNGGFGAAVNSGAKAARGDFLLILNSDLELDSDFLTKLVLQAGPFGRAITAPRVLDATDSTTYSARQWPRVLHHTVEWLTPLARWRDTRLIRRLLGHNNRAVSATEPLDVDWLVGAAFMLPRLDFQVIGGIDERYYMNSEEVDLQRRLAERGLKRIYIPSVSVVHEGGGSSDPTKRRRWLVTSQLRYAEKWGGLTQLRLALTLATAINFAWNCMRALRGVDIRPFDVARYELSLAWGPV